MKATNEDDRQSLADSDDHRNTKATIDINSIIPQIEPEINSYYSLPESKRNGLSRCYYCLGWLKTDLVSLVVWVRPGRTTIAFGVCIFCSTLREKFCHSLKIEFARKCEKNIEATFHLEGLEAKRD